MVLEGLCGVIKENLPSETSMMIDLGPDYAFPPHLVCADLRSDSVWWNNTTKRVTPLELTVPFHTARGCCKAKASQVQ